MGRSQDPRLACRDRRHRHGRDGEAFHFVSGARQLFIDSRETTAARRLQKGQASARSVASLSPQNDTQVPLFSRARQPANFPQAPDRTQHPLLTAEPTAARSAAPISLPSSLSLSSRGTQAADPPRDRRVPPRRMGRAQLAGHRRRQHNGRWVELLADLRRAKVALRRVEAATTIGRRLV